jgi:hypothetical protein
MATRAIFATSRQDGPRIQFDSLGPGSPRLIPRWSSSSHAAAVSMSLSIKSHERGRIGLRSQTQAAGSRVETATAE